MSEVVGKIPAFVFRHGELAQEILFPDGEGEIPGITPEERAAMNAVEPLLAQTWAGILTACRTSIVARAQGRPWATFLELRPTRSDTMFRQDVVRMPLARNGRATCGVNLSSWGEPTFHLFAWIWTHASLVDAAEAAVAGLSPAPWRNEHRSFFLTLDPPREGETYAAVGERVAEAMWPMLAAIGDAIHAAGRTA